MSGGHWDYREYRIDDLVQDVYNDKRLKEEFPQELREMIQEVGGLLFKTIHELDYHLSGDTHIEDPKEYYKMIRDLLYEKIDHYKHKK